MSIESAGSTVHAPSCPFPKDHCDCVTYSVACDCDWMESQPHLGHHQTCPAWRSNLPKSSSPMPGAAPVGARTCRGCGGDFPITCYGVDPLKGYWHLDCLREARSKLPKAGHSSGSARERALAWLKEYEVDPDLDRVESLTALLSSPFTRPAFAGTRMCPSCGVSVEVDGQACEQCSSRAKGPAR